MTILDRDLLEFVLPLEMDNERDQLRKERALSLRYNSTAQLHPIFKDKHYQSILVASPSNSPHSLHLGMQTGRGDCR